MDKKLRVTTNYNEQLTTTGAHQFDGLLTTSNGETWSRCRGGSRGRVQGVRIPPPFLR